MEACRSLVAYLKRGEIVGAVNLTGVRLDLPPDEAPFADLAARIGRLLTAYFGDGGFASLTVRASGTRAPKLLETLKRLAAVELLSAGDGGAGQRGERRVAGPGAWDRAVGRGRVRPAVGVDRRRGGRPRVREGGEGDRSHRILGTAYADGLPRVLRVDDYAMDLVPEGEMVLIENDDQPGVIGAVGQAFGSAGINIADMVISRSGPRALMVLKIDAAPTAALLGDLRGRPNVRRVTPVTLPPRRAG